MVVNFSQIDFNERPMLILKNAGDTPLGVLGFAKNISPDLKYNETSGIEFEVPEYVDGEATPYYNDIIGMRTLELQGVGQFTLISPTEIGDGVKKIKKCKGYSLEYEFVYKKISLPNDTYKFWDEEKPEETLLGMIMELMPSWSIGSVSEGLRNKYRTFEVNNENLYNLIKGTVQSSYGCIFDFDTMARTVHVRDAGETPIEKPVFLSLRNLAKEIEVKENTEDVFTRLDVNGAEGVTIRDVNPTGTNKIINLDYYMTEENFSLDLIEKYNEWKCLCADNRMPYYICSVRYALKTEQKIAEMAKLADLQGELTTLENLQAVTIEGIAQGLKTQEDLDAANADIAAKKAEMDAKQSEVDALQAEIEAMFEQMKETTDACSFEGYFSEDEYRLLDRYIKDGEISEASFVVAEVASYENKGNGRSVDAGTATFSGCDVSTIDQADGGAIYDIRGGKIDFGDELSANVISAVIDKNADGTFLISAYLSSGTIEANAFPGACVSITGRGEIETDANSVVINLTEGYRYFTPDATEYEKRSVSWELYEYGEEVLEKLAVPTYSFSVTSANFLKLDEFTAFKDALTLGEKIYLDLGERGVLRPIAIGVRFSFDDPGSMELLFSDSYTSSDSTFRLIDLLEKGISMGKNVELSKHVYSSFVDSGASTGLREYMTSALDVAKNAILSSTDQAISWDGAGIRLRKWTSDAHTAYEPEQIWMNNNSIVMTDDNWATAEMAIGKFYDENLGECWGIVAPRIVGTLLAGEALVIESAKKDGGTAQFRIDGDGCRIYNSDISVFGSSHIVLNPEIGFAIGAYPLYNVDVNTGGKTLNSKNARFWADTNGNLYLTGNIVATSLTIQDGSVNKPVDEYVSDRVNPVQDSLEELIDTVDGETVIYYQKTTPTNAKNKDIWYNTLTHVIRRYVNGAWTDITNTTLGLSLKAISDAQATADGKIVTFAQSAAPTAAAVGDLWIDTDDNNKLYRWNGYSWIAYRDSHLDYLVDKVDGKTTTFYSDDTPTGAVNNDIWYDTDDHKIRRMVNGEWVDITDEALYDALTKAGTAQATADGKIVTFAQNEAPTAAAVGDLWIDTNDNNKLYRWNGYSWIAYRDSHLDYLVDKVDGKTTTFYSDDTPTGAVNNDIWYDTDDHKIRRMVNGEWVDITDEALYDALTKAGTAQATADGKIVTFAQSTAPTAAAVGDLWIDTDDNNKLYRWNGANWISCRDLTIEDAQSAANSAYSLAQKVWNGENGIFFNSSNVSQFALNTTVGLKITGSDGTYFQVKNDAMGFFKSDGSAMLYYENGNMTLNGIIAATGGYIGGTGGWIIGTNCMYNGGASYLGAGSGIYLGTSGISIGSAIVMKPDGSFIIRGDSTSTDSANYVFKIVPETTSAGKVYRMHLGNIVFDDGFVIPQQNGGTGGADRFSAGEATGIYRVATATEMYNLRGVANGDVCIVFAAGSYTASISGERITSTTTSPGYLAIAGPYADGHRYVDYFDITGIKYWNIYGLDNETVSSSYARVGVGNTVSGAAGLYVPISISATGTFTSITVTFVYSLRPYGCSDDLCSSWQSAITISMYKGNSDSKIATTSYTIPDEWQSPTATERTATITLSSASGLTSGEYYIAFYTRSAYSLMWIRPSGIAIAGTSVTSDDGLYIRSGNEWKLIGSAA